MNRTCFSFAFLLSTLLALPLQAQTRGPGESRGRRVAERERVDAPRLTEAQRALLRAELASARAIVANARLQAQKLRAAGGDPAVLRERLAALRRETLDTLRPAAQRLLATRTPEQRARMEERAQRRGRTIDEARLTERATRRLARAALRRGDERPNATR